MNVKLLDGVMDRLKSAVVTGSADLHALAVAMRAYEADLGAHVKDLGSHFAHVQSWVDELEARALEGNKP